MTGLRIRSSTWRATCSSRQARFGANLTADLLSSTNPAAPIPTASTSYLASSSHTASLSTSTVADALAAGVGRLTISTIEPFSSTTPAAIFVPPTSTPMVRLMVRLFLLFAGGPAAGSLTAGSLLARRAVRVLARAGVCRAVGQYRVKSCQRIARGANQHVGRTSEPGDCALRRCISRCSGSTATALSLRLRHPPCGAADRAPRALRRLIGRIRWFCRGRGPYIGPVVVLTAEGLLDLALEFIAHVARARPDQPPLHVVRQVGGAALPRVARSPRPA